MTDANGKSGGYGPNIQFARLFEKTSANGNQYFVGRWGGAKVALLKAREPAEDGAIVWNLVLSEAPAVVRKGGAQ
jgi:hypothetical protein